MKLTLKRLWPSFSCVIGELYVDGVFEAFSLEDTVRPDGTKIPGKTAIPEGTYRLILSESRRFCRELPLLLDVPGFTGIRIHAGNTCEDTEGCILVGYTRGDASIGKSRLALETLLLKIKDACCTDHVTITVEGAAEGDPMFAKSSSGERTG
jgi:hypothetical protein